VSKGPLKALPNPEANADKNQAKIQKCLRSMQIEIEIFLKNA
jgi:hypothetical protein